MDFLDLLKGAGGADGVSELAAAVGLDSADAGKLVSALGPALLGG